MSAATTKRPKLGLDFFSLRAQGWSAFELLDFAANNGAETAHFSEPRFLGNLEDAHLAKVKAHADRLGLSIEVGFGSICPTSSRFKAEDGPAHEQLLRMMKVAKALGSPLVRCYLGSSQDRSGSIPFEQHIENTVATCKKVRSQALDLGVKIAVENHSGDMQALQLKGLIEAAGKDYVGALIDTGNATWTLEDPMHTLETLAPYALTTGVRDSAIWETEEGAAVMWVPLGKGNVGIDRWIKRLAELRPDIPFSLEMINLATPRPFAFRKREFWDAYRDVPAWVFAGFLELAKNGREYRAPSAPAGADAKEFAKELERADAERDLAYARAALAGLS